MFIYSIFDKKAVSFGPLFTCANDELAKRLVAVELLKDSMLASCPTDFSLYCLGEYNSDNGNVSGFSPINIVCEVIALVKVDKNSES